MKHATRIVFFTMLVCLGVTQALGQTLRTVGATGADYSTLKAAFDAINSGTLAGAVTLQVIDNTTETASAVLNASGTGAANYASVTIYPTVSGKSIVGTIAGSGGTIAALIDLNGADNVTIDGRVNQLGASRDLTIDNQSTSNVSSTIRLHESATNNTVKYSNVYGASTVGNNAATIQFSESLSGTGVDNNLVDNCNIGPSGTNYPLYAFYSVGRLNIINDHNTISNCNIYDFRFSGGGTAQDHRGIYLAGTNSDWTIEGNSLYQTGTGYPGPGGVTVTGIYVNNTGGNYQIRNNYIGGNGPGCSGIWTINGTAVDYKFTGILLAPGASAAASTIHNNTIKGFSWLTANSSSGSNVWTGISAASGTVNIGALGNGNTIGDNGTGSITVNATAGTGSTIVYGILVNSNNSTISYNTVGSIIANANSAIQIIGIKTAGLTSIISNNLVGNENTVNSINIAIPYTGSGAQEVTGIMTGNSPTVSNNVIANLNNNQATAGGGGKVTGISVPSSTPPFIITDNTIRNLASAGRGAKVLVGIDHPNGGGTGGTIVSGNTIYSLAGTGTGATAFTQQAYGIYWVGTTSGTNVISRNTIHSISLASSTTGSAIYGIYSPGSRATLDNNMVRLGIDGGGNGISIGYAIYGIYETSATNELYNNSVYVGGASVTGVTSSTYAFFSDVVTNTRMYKDNIFVNARSGGTTGRHYAIAVGGTGVNPAGLTSNNNVYYVSGTNSVFGRYAGVDRANLAAWQTAIGQDANSLSGDPAFLNPTGSSATVDLHINSNANPIPVGYDGGTPIAGITNDFDGETRSATTPDIGADEYVIFRSIAASAGSNGSVLPAGVTNVNYGASQNYSIVPDAGYAVQDVLVDGVSAGAVASYTFSNITANHTISATFVQNTFTITSSAGANGSISPTPTAVVGAGGNQTFVVTPDAGYHVADVLVDNTSVGAVTLYTFSNVNANHTIAASFAINTYPLNTAVVGNGSIGKAPDLSAYNHGSVVIITAIPAVGWSFSGWSGDASGSTNPLNVTMDAAKNITASFTLNTYTLNVSATNGSVTKIPDQPSYDHGTAVSLTATPDPGHAFTGWSGDASGSANPLSLTMDGNKNIAANFALLNYIISATAGPNGGITPSGNTTVSHGGSLSYTITPDLGYQVIDVLVDGVSAGAVTSYSFTNVTANHTISATFNLNTFTISSSAGSNGSISPSPSAIVNYGGNQTFTITPNVGYHIADVLVDNVTVGAVTSYSFTNVTANHSIAASFAINTYTLTAAAGPNGSMNPSGVTNVNYGDNQSYAISPSPGYHTADVLVDNVSVGAVTSYSFNNVTANHTISASFAILSYSLNITIVGSGSVAKAPDQATYDHGTVVSLTATPVIGWTFAGWSGDATGPANPLNVTMDAAKNITATFTINVYTLTINATNGTVAKNPDQLTYTHGLVVQLTASPSVGYSFTGWTGDASGTTNPLAVTMDGNKNITANFVLNALGTITGSVKVNGVGLANVVVKLLDSDGNFIPAFPAITTSSAGMYSFTDVPSGLDYQVMIVEPLGYSVDENPKLLTLTAAGVTVNFTLTLEVVSNRARGVAYWKHQFDEHRCRRRHCEETEAQLLSYIAAVHEHYDPHFSIFQNLTTIDQWGDVLTVGGRSAMRDRAKKQLAALLMNLVSLKIGQYTIVTRDNRTAGDVLTYVSILITDNTPANDQLARNLAMKVNNRDMIAAGVVPVSNVLYKGRENQITWTFDIPTEYGLSQNYPNPFNPSTTIQYDMPVQDHVSLKIYNALGQEVATIVEQAMDAGKYQVEWNANGSAAGIYFCRIHVGAFTKVRKMLLLK